MVSSVASPPPNLEVVSFEKSPHVHRVVVLSPYGVYPSRSGGHTAVLEPARQLARTGISVHLFGMGIRRFEAFRHWRSFVRPLEPHLIEERSISPWNWMDFLRRRRRGLPPIRMGQSLQNRPPSSLRDQCLSADAVVFESPWLFRFDPRVRPRILVCHNVEAKLFEDSGIVPKEQIEATAQIESHAYHAADRVLCLTENDRSELLRRYGPRDHGSSSTSVVPLGVDTNRLHPPSIKLKRAAKKRLGLEGRFVALFAGAWHLPNKGAMDQMMRWGANVGEAAASSRLLFVVAGSVGRKPASDRHSIVTGYRSDLSSWFQAADCFVNPITEGSGANLKVLEAMAWGLPVITTKTGARGLEELTDRHLLVRSLADFPDAVQELAVNPGTGQTLAKNARTWVEEKRSWRRLAKKRLEILESCVPGDNER